jgi:molybdopterin biosynthesis enzyme MoaB
LVDSIDEIESNPSLFGSIEYESVNQKLKEKKDESLNWLEEQLRNEHQVKYSEEYRILNDRLTKIEKMLHELMKH